MQYLTLNNKVEMPILGYGTFQIEEAAQCEQCVSEALQLGYRLIDTASAYFNEEAVGVAIHKSGIPREELFISSKLWLQDAGEQNTLAAFDASLQRLGLDYLDLYLIHQPFGDYYGSWRAMERLLRQGRVRAIGVSNFSPDRIADLCLHGEIPPAINQIELHPFHQQHAALQVLRDYGVQPQAWGPLCEGQKNIFQHPILRKIAEKHGKSVAQIVLRWNIQRSVAVIPRSAQPLHMAENIDIFDFELTQKEILAIAKLDLGHSEIIDHRSASTVKWLSNWQIHE